MSKNEPGNQPKALVTVFEDLQAVSDAIHELVIEGVKQSNIEVVTYDVRDQSHDVATPKVRETTSSSVVDGMVKDASLGAGAGLAGGLILAIATAFPGIIIGTVLIGTLVGGFVGVVDGVEHAEGDDSVNLPTIKEYEEMLEQGRKLLVVHGTHAELENAKGIVVNQYHLASHIHSLHGHQYHEHPAHE